MFENKKVMAKNILHYMDVNNVTATDVCKACGFKQNTFSDWVNAKTYPRIDKIELMARYFHINKSKLVEDWIDENSYLHHEPGHMAATLVHVASLPEYDFDSTEQEIIKAYRKADSLTKAMVLRTLGLEDKEKRECG